MLGAVVLAITGAEALYADMGHFGKRPIRLAWFTFVFPALLLNYFGQGALLLREPQAVQHPFFHLAPEWALMPMVVLATLATVIASQAVISRRLLDHAPGDPARLLPAPDRRAYFRARDRPGVSAVGELGPVPRGGGPGARLRILQQSGRCLWHRRHRHHGDRLASSIFFVMRKLWNWPLIVAAPISLTFLFIDLSFFSANLIKLLEGGWFPVVVGIAVFTLLSTWKRGRQVLFERLRPGAIGVEPFIKSIIAHPPLRVPGTAVFLTATQEGVPHALLHNLNHNKVLHERVVLLTVRAEDIPHVPDSQRLDIEPLGHDFYKVTVHYGFKDEPDLPAALALAARKAWSSRCWKLRSFCRARRSCRPRHPAWRFGAKSSSPPCRATPSSATVFFKIPTNRVVELGTRIEL